MNTGVHRIIGILTLAAALTGGLLVYRADAAPAQCFTEVTLSAPGAGNAEFIFQGFDSIDGPFSFSLMDGVTGSGFTPVGATSTITEEPQNGYVFAGIECLAGPGVVITQIHGGFIIKCLNVVEGTASCVITNVLQVRNIPTLSEWGMIAAALGLGFVGLFFAVRRRRARAV
jgi:hypothetical protein